jgi:hypothetical protein
MALEDGDIWENCFNEEESLTGTALSVCIDSPKAICSKKLVNHDSYVNYCGSILPFLEYDLRCKAIKANIKLLIKFNVRVLLTV